MYAGLGASDPMAAVWKAVTPADIGTHVGPDGWWYDDVDNHRLGVPEADHRKQLFIAPKVGTYVGADGWWYDNIDNHRLTSAEAFQRWQALQHGAPVTSTPAGWSPVEPPPSGAGSSVPPVPVPDGATAPVDTGTPTGLPGAAGAIPGQTTGGTMLFGLTTTQLVLGAAAIGAAVLVLRKGRHD